MQQQAHTAGADARIPSSEADAFGVARAKPFTIIDQASGRAALLLNRRRDGSSLDEVCRVTFEIAGLSFDAWVSPNGMVSLPNQLSGLRHSELRRDVKAACRRAMQETIRTF